MEFGIAFVVTFIIGSFISYGKKQNQKAKPSSSSVAEKSQADAVHQQKLKQADEELITVILPTINNDK